ncbi:MAG: heme o synthase [Thermoplasmatota archaeon]|nr:heme o synthase [Halobacteriales archaeon]
MTPVEPEAFGRPLSPPVVAGRPLRQVVADYVQISKPRILLLLLVVAWAAMFVAASGWPAWPPFLAVTAAGTFSVAASGALNNVLERRRDRQMDRTAHRAVAAGRIPVSAAVVYASIMAVLSYASLALLGLWWAAALTLGAIAYYVVVYTVVLKPSTPQNIVVGGLAGSFPALIGWAAATGGLSMPAAAPAVALAALVFLWTPPHFWSLALLYKDQYEAAGFPMMPSVRGEASTRRQVLAYSVLTVAASLAIAWPAAHAAGWLYVAAAAILGAELLRRAIGLLRSPAAPRYRSFFLFTIQYLGFLLLALMADRALISAVPGLAT